MEASENLPTQTWTSCLIFTIQEKKQVSTSFKSLKLTRVWFVETQTSLIKATVFEKYQKICANHNSLAFYKPGNTLKQRLVHPKDRIPKHQQSNKCSKVQGEV